ncbi:MAG: AMP-binding protein [Candidatus Acidiferrales bacterium]
MLDLSRYSCLGAALRDALERWPDEVCLIEADRDRENCRLTYHQFKEAALPLARGLQDQGFQPGSRAAILMTNQSKWLISAYAIFYCGGVLVPLDYKLTPAEQIQLLAHSRAEVLVTEHHISRAIAQSPDFANLHLKTVLVTEAPADADLSGAQRWESWRGSSEPEFFTRERRDPACIVYSSGTGGRPKGCVLTHENYLEQCMAVTPIFPFSPGARYLSIIPTNHAIDFMGGFIMPFTGGGAVVHLRSLRPEFIRDAFTRYKITYMAVVPLILKNLQNGLRERFAALPPFKRRLLNALISVNRALTRRRPNVALSRALLKDVHHAFGGGLRALLVGGAFTEPATIEFFHDLGIPIFNGYGCTEACTAITLNDLKPFRPDTVGRPVRGMEIRTLNPSAEGIGDVAVRSKTVMLHYLDNPEMTAEVLVDGWLVTGDLGRIDETGHLQLFGRKKNIIVTEEGKNIYPEDIENVFEGLPVKEFCIFAANYLWPQRTMVGEQLVIVVHPDTNQPLNATLSSQIEDRNRRLANYKRVSGIVMWNSDFPRTAAMKIKRDVLAEEIRGTIDRSAVLNL